MPKPRRSGTMSACVLVNPKYPHNVGGAIRACAAFGIPNLCWTGKRIDIPRFGGRLPREERMREYNNAVKWIQYDKPLNLRSNDPEVNYDGVPVAIEIHP